MSQWCGGLLSRLLYASLLALETLLDPVIMSPFADSVPTLVLKIIESRKDPEGAWLSKVITDQSGSELGARAVVWSLLSV